MGQRQGHPHKGSGRALLTGSCQLPNQGTAFPSGNALAEQARGFRQSPKLRPPHMGSPTNPMQILAHRCLRKAKPHATASGRTDAAVQQGAYCEHMHGTTFQLGLLAHPRNVKMPSAMLRGRACAARPSLRQQCRACQVSRAGYEQGGTRLQLSPNSHGVVSGWRWGGDGVVTGW